MYSRTRHRRCHTRRRRLNKCSSKRPNQQISYSRLPDIPDMMSHSTGRKSTRKSRQKCLEWATSSTPTVIDSIRWTYISACGHYRHQILSSFFSGPISWWEARQGNTVRWKINCQNHDTYTHIPLELYFCIMIWSIDHGH